MKLVGENADVSIDFENCEVDLCNRCNAMLTHGFHQLCIGDAGAVHIIDFNLPFVYQHDCFALDKFAKSRETVNSLFQQEVDSEKR